ncbi:uncharacterized protein LOC129577568 [Sitodiplosis mosellana]|uniref:uncharacterized protein LOC129577568 n=1 Tax=Sitodiplosis mosellana TaxID=263140 RepID=UPI002444C12A|nr:uncharacterized protein LOC129577568 [Sitodiplosis mosellana]
MEGNAIRFVNEARSSRLCARCFEPFPLSTLNDLVKVCEWCMLDQDDWPDGMKLPEKIVAAKSKRKLRSERRAMRQAAVQNPDQPLGFVSKVICYRKNWQQNAANGMDDNVEERRGVSNHGGGIIEYTDEYEPEDPVDDFSLLKTVWQRDISAAKLILYRGHCELIGHRLHDAFTLQHSLSSITWNDTCDGIFSHGTSFPVRRALATCNNVWFLIFGYVRSIYSKCSVHWERSSV